MLTLPLLASCGGGGGGGGSAPAKKPMAQTLVQKVVKKPSSTSQQPEANSPQQPTGSTPTQQPALAAQPISLADLTQLANAGDNNSQYQLGKRYEAGTEVTKDLDVAVDWYLKAAVQHQRLATRALIALAPTQGKALSALVSLSKTDVAAKATLREWSRDGTFVDADGDGLIEIHTIDQLDHIRHNLAGTNYNNGSQTFSTGCPSGICKGYELANDLNFQNASHYYDPANKAIWTLATGWNPIGGSGSSFGAIFEGNGHIIEHLYINKTTTAAQAGIGLFGATGGTAFIRNIELTKVSVYVSSSALKTIVGALVGNNGGFIQNAITAGKVTLNGTGDDNRVGGMVGSIDGSGIVQNAAVFGVIKGLGASVEAYAGGLVGVSDGIIETVFAKVTVYDDGDDASVGGIVAYHAGIAVRNVVSLGVVSGPGNNAHIGGLIGYVEEDVANALTNSIVSGTTSNIGWLAGTLDGGTVEASFWNDEFAPPANAPSRSIGDNSGTLSPNSKLKKSVSLYAASIDADFDSWRKGSNSGIKWNTTDGHYMECDIDVSLTDDCENAVWTFPTWKYPQIDFENIPVAPGQKRFWTEERVQQLYK